MAASSDAPSSETPSSKALSSETIAEIRFYEPDDAYGFLSNFYPAPIEIDGVVWPSSEHYYHAQKFKKPALQRAILDASAPDDAFALSRELALHVREDWEAVRCEVMQLAVWEKFRQHPALCQQLLATEPALLIENSPCDGFWGCGRHGDGENQLGQILMSVREALLKNVRYV